MAETTFSLAELKHLAGLPPDTQVIADIPARQAAAETAWVKAPTGELVMVDGVLTWTLTGRCAHISKHVHGDWHYYRHGESLFKLRRWPARRLLSLPERQRIDIWLTACHDAERGGA